MVSFGVLQLVVGVRVGRWVGKEKWGRCGGGGVGARGSELLGAPLPGKNGQALGRGLAGKSNIESRKKEKLARGGYWVRGLHRP